jgi:hypothetical protein
MRVIERPSGRGGWLASLAGRPKLAGRRPVVTGPGHRHPVRRTVRVRAAGLTLAFLVVILAVVVSLAVRPGALDSVRDAPGGAPPATAGRCVVPAPTTAAGYTAAFAGVDGDWAAGDQASSTRLPDGRVVWLFADTLVGGRLVHNSLVLQDQGCFKAVPGPDRGEVIPNPAPGTWYWPQHAIADGTRVWVTAVRVAGTSSGFLGFRVLGVDLAEFEVIEGGSPRLVAVHATPASGAGDFGVLWGTGVGREGTTLYLYGTRRVPGSTPAGKELLLARVSRTNLADPSAWRYRTITGWTRDPAQAAVLVPACGGMSTALSAHRSDLGWVLVTKRDDFLGDAVIALVGPDSWGPFRERMLFASTTTAQRLEYLPLAHPELPLEDGSLLVSLNHNNIDHNVVLSNPAAFRPTFHAVHNLS